MKESLDYIKYRTICCVPVEFLETNAMEVEMQISDAVREIMDHAEAGSAYFQCKLAKHYGRGDGIAKDEAKAIEWYRKAAEQGYEKAQYELGNVFYCGIGVEKSEEEAIKWYERAANKGYVEAMEQLCRVYFQHMIYHKKNGEKTYLYWKQKAANAGSSFWQWMLGDDYLKGCYEYSSNICLLKADAKMAVFWYKKAAEQGDEKALDKLGDCYYKGIGVKQNYEEAVRCYHESASKRAQSSKESQYKLANCYLQGIGTEKNEQEAFRWYQKASEHGHVKSKYILAECYYNGVGIKQDYKSAIECYKDFIQSSSLIQESDYYDAKYKVAECYYHGFGVKQNYEEAIKRYEEINNNTSKENKRILDSRCRLGDCYYHIYKNELEENNRMAKSVLDGQRSLEDYNLNVNFGEKLKYAINYYESAALKGHTEAVFKLGDCYYNGIIGVEQSYDKAIKWYQKITENSQNDAKIVSKAHCRLGDCYYNKKTADDVKKAIEYYQKAFAGGYEEIQSKLREVCYKEAERYYYGKDETWIDYEEAVKLYQESAQLGYAAAQYKLGCIYKTGLRAVKFDTKHCMESYQGLKKDILLAAQWLKKAMEQGYENAQKEYNSLFTIFTVGQLQKHGFVRVDD